MADNATAAGQGPATQAVTTNDGDPCPTRPLPVCPLCSEQLVTLSDRCPFCFGDLRLLMRLVQMADRYFNLAVVAAREKRWWEAAEHLAVTRALREDDVDALMLLGKVRRSGGQHDLANAAWQEALRHAPDRADIRQAIDWASRSMSVHHRKGKRPPR